MQRNLRSITDRNEPASKRLETPDSKREHVLFDGELVKIGSLRLPVDDPDFEDTGPIERPIFVFPRTSCLIQHEGSSAFVTDTTTVTFYNEGQRYRRAARDARGDACEWFSVREDVLREAVARWDPGSEDQGRPVFSFEHGSSDPRTYLLQRRVVRWLRRDEAADQLAVEETVLTLLASVLARSPLASDGKSPCSVTTNGGLAAAVREAVRASFRRSGSLEELADQVGASVYHMCRDFRSRTGITIHRYRHQLRLRQALEDVARPEEDLSRVAFRLGYSSHSHFTASFKTIFGTTPSAFRRRASSRSIRELAERIDLCIEPDGPGGSNHT